MDESLKKQAYSQGLKLKNTGIGEEGIYARLEKQGIPENLARQVAKNVMLQKKLEEDLIQKPVNRYSITYMLIKKIFS